MMMRILYFGKCKIHITLTNIHISIVYIIEGIRYPQWKTSEMKILNDKVLTIQDTYSRQGVIGAVS